VGTHVSVARLNAPTASGQATAAPPTGGVFPAEGADFGGYSLRAQAHIVAEAGPGGSTRLTRRAGQVPLLPRRTSPVGSPVAQVHLVGGAAGPLAGDQLRVLVEVGSGATLVVHSVAATLALPGRAADSAQPSRLEVIARVAAGGRLDWLPEPLIAATGCRHESLSTVDVAAGGFLTWRDELVCGRHAEPCGYARQVTTIRLAGRPLYRHELSVGPGVPGWAGPAGLAGARAAGSLVVVDPIWAAPPRTTLVGTTPPLAAPPQATPPQAAPRQTAPPQATPPLAVLGRPEPAGWSPGPGWAPGSGPPATRILGPTAVIMPLAGPALLACATGSDPRTVRAALDEARPRQTLPDQTRPD